MPLIQVTVNQSRIEISPVRIESAAKRILNALGFTDVELSVLIVDDPEMTRINREYRGIDSSTDVLSFPMREGEFGDVCTELLGDVVICAPVAMAMSDEHGCPFSLVLDLLLAHGILHLTGYDHEAGDNDAKAMNEKTVELLDMLGHSREDYEWFLA
jgi:probable rRNA maturation factor